MYGLIQTAYAQVFDGPGLQGGVDVAGTINGPLHGTPREIILTYLYAVLSFVALLGVVMIVIAGIILMVSAGRDDWKDWCKKIILYTVIGIIIILLARLLVGFLLYGLPNV